MHSFKSCTHKQACLFQHSVGKCNSYTLTADRQRVMSRYPHSKQGICPPWADRQTVRQTDTPHCNQHSITRLSFSSGQPVIWQLDMYAHRAPSHEATPPLIPHRPFSTTHNFLGVGPNSISVAGMSWGRR